jgi:tRNA-specific 2-thiouridylase
MGICFVGEVDIRQFLKQYIDLQPGPIIDEQTGQRLGTHEGVPFYTVGQRHGLHLGSHATSLPYYVARKDLATNPLYVTRDLNSKSLWSTSVKLVQVLISGDTGDIKARVRHRGPLLDARFTPDSDPTTATVTFADPEKALEPGQSVVCYGGPDYRFVVATGIIRSNHV